MKQIILFFVLTCAIVIAVEPNPPVWPDTVFVVDPADGTAQSRIDQIFSQQGGHNPPLNGQFSSQRYAILFKPGVHNLNVNVGYYTQVMGLGSSPLDTKIQSVIVENGDYYFELGALCNFWRSAENFYTRPTQTWNGVPNSMLWAVSQASPLRRVIVDGNLQLYQYNYGDAAGYASGGYMADMTVNGVVYSGSQQQFISRNSKFGFWQGALWNYVFVGVQNPPGASCSDNGSTSTTVIPNTPIIAEKPFIVFEGGKYYLAVPRLKTNSLGPSVYGSDFDRVGFENVYVATQSDSVDTINAKLALGLHLILTPGTYKLSGSIIVNNANTVVLGLGLANLVSGSGQPCIVVGNVDGVRISGLLLEASSQNTNSLIQWGTSNYVGNRSNPGILQDLFTRVGGPLNPNVQQVSATNMVVINSGNVILDDLWLWRADHFDGGLVYSSYNPNQVGIQVNGDNVIAYGLAVEHSLGDLVQWNGNNGQVFFYQSELPYDVTQANYGDKGYVSYRVNDNVTSHSAYGIGVYSFFRDNSVAVANGISTPSRAGVSVFNAMSVFLNGKGSINHIINNSGSSVQGPTFMIKYKCVTQ